MCSDKGAVHVVRCVLLLKAVCLGGFKRDAATLVVGLDQLKIALAARRPSRRGVSRNGVLAEKFHILTSTGALNLQLFDCKYEDVRKAAVLQTLEAIFSKH